MSAHLHGFTCVNQRIPSTCHPQQNVLTEKQNSIIQNAFVKEVMDLHSEE